MEDRLQNYYNKAKAAIKTKECPKCERMFPVKDFTKGQTNCNECVANRYVTCRCGCGRKLLEINMGIFDCDTNKYFYSQPHKDRHDGVKRDRQGFVVKMIA